MSALDNLPPDQRAVLQLVLQRGRSYDEIAGLLSIERAAVRQRALDGFDALTPPAVLPGPERGLVTDYLLGQLPEKVSEQVYAYLESADADRDWAQAIASEVAPLTSRALPEIPVGAPLGADASSTGGLEQYSDSPAIDAPAPFEPEEDLEAHEETIGTTAVTGASVVPLPAQTHSWDPPPGAVAAPRSSRRGGAILLGIVAVVIVAAVIVGVVSSGGSSPKKTARTPTRTRTTSANATHTLVQLNLDSPAGLRSIVGVAQVIRKDGVVGIVIVAQGVPANTKHNAYAVWLYNSPTSHEFVGFVPNLVGKNGKLATEGRLPADAGAYHHLLITLETQSKPKSPGQVVLAGPFRES
jgi:hypothetical protein